MSSYSIYCIKNKTNGKVYIGQTKTINIRKNKHFSQLRRNEHGNPHLQRVWTKYGEDNFEFLVLEKFSELFSQEIIDSVEKSYIKWYKDLGLAYNIKEGGKGGGGIADETRQKLKAARAKQTLSPEHIEAFRKSNIGRKQSPEEIERRAQKLRGIKRSQETIEKLKVCREGYKHSPETIEKLRISHLGHVPSEETRKKKSDQMMGEKNHFYGKTYTEETKEKIRGLGMGYKWKPESINKRTETTRRNREQALLNGIPYGSSSPEAIAKKNKTRKENKFLKSLYELEQKHTKGDYPS